ncbi:hypothetical protein BGZ65_004958 [Modicella reniformis]|uniref:Uncharacterized protein n=1 Tax=Modicella reniformis TaxID=1440133 RepID=A0A9P6M8Q0_9FUNG|nr:hypothetical protein BGZ65_004958 [Modicella reniformis]
MLGAYLTTTETGEPIDANRSDGAKVIFIDLRKDARQDATEPNDHFQTVDEKLRLVLCDRRYPACGYIEGAIFVYRTNFSLKSPSQKNSKLNQFRPIFRDENTILTTKAVDLQTVSQHERQG